MAVNADTLERAHPQAEADDDLRARILLVDDHPPNLLALEAILAPLEQEIVTASSGEDALRKLLQADVALILMDVQMPGLDGFQTAALIRKRERNRSTPIVFLTAIARDPRLVFHGYSSGAVDYLLKPFDPEILRNKVSVFVELWKKTELVKRQQALLRAQERRELERRAEGRFRAIIDSMPACVWVARRDGGIAYCNRAWTEYAGVEGGIGFFEAVPGDEALALRAAWETATREAEPLEREQRLRRHDGHYRWHLLRVAPEKDPGGAVLGFIATAIDIDHQKRVEEAHAALLAREQRAREEAEVANRTKDEFLATVSHELRTPLNAILGWTRMLRSGTAQRDKLERALSTIERNARSQAQLVEDLLDVSRIIAGKLRLQVQQIDLVPLVQAATDALRPAAEAKELEIELRLPQLLPFEGDPDRLQQVIANLLSNAIKYTPAGKVTVEARRQGCQAEVVISDTGIGISPELLPHVFERFRQGDGASGGLGLGLAIVRHLVEVHGGSVLAESDGEGRGARFTVRLPVRDAREQPQPPVAEPAPAEPRPSSADLLSDLRVLVVEDDADARELVVELLGSCGASVAAAETAADALRAFAAGGFDAVVTDLGLPGDDGYALLRNLRSLPAGREVPVIALTAYAGHDEEQRALAAGFDRHLSKPVDSAALVAGIAAAVQARSPAAAAVASVSA